VSVISDICRMHWHPNRGISSAIGPRRHEGLRLCCDYCLPHPVNRLFLFGLSEGAIAAATYEGQTLRGRVIEASTCHAGWPEYRGLRARPEEAVLALTSENDPWYQDPALRGDCSEALGPATPSRQGIVFRPPHPAASHHDLMWNHEVRRAVPDVLKRASGV
jgi:hypothetical protein